MNILRGNMAKIDLIDLRADVHIVGHLGRCGHIAQCQIRTRPKLLLIGRRAGEGSARRLCTAQGIDLFHLLHHFKEPGAAGQAVSLQ